MFEIIFGISAVLYFAIVFFIAAGLRRQFPIRSSSEFPSVSVVIAARNEEKNIQVCMESLDNLTYPEEKLEIIIVDDGSTDDTQKIVLEFIKDKQNFKLVSLKESEKEVMGKAGALDKGIEASSGEIIFTTDADCIVPPEWVDSIIKYYTDETGAVCGFTQIHPTTMFEGIQALDLQYLLTVASGTINNNYLISGIGNNMSYRKKAYYNAGGYKNIKFSVTEDFKLLNALYEQKEYKVIFPPEPKAVVETAACSGIRELFHQKKRWSAGGLEAPVRAYPLLIVSFLTAFFIAFIPLFYSAVWLYLLTLKLALDLVLLYSLNQVLDKNNNLKYFIPFQIYLILYILIIPVILLFNRKIIWKGREY